MNYFSKNLYERLGLTRHATDDEIKLAFRKLASKYHPDRNQDDSATEIMQSIQEAYAILSKTKSRQTYDETGDIDINPEKRFELLVDAELMVLLNRALAHFNANPAANYLKFMQGEFRARLDMFSRDERDIESRVANLSLIADRFDTPEGESVFRDLIESQIAEQRARMKGLDECRRIVTAALERLSACHYNSILDGLMNMSNPESFSNPMVWAR